MGAGDTIPGQVRVRGEFTDGSEPRLLGPFNQDRVDYHNNTVSPDEKLYVNTAISSRVSKPAGAESVTEPRLTFSAGETFKVEHKSASLEEAIDYDDADLVEIDVMIKDLNRGVWFPRTLTVQDTGLSANPTSSNSSWVEIFTFTVPDRQRMNVVGTFGIIAPENA